MFLPWAFLHLSCMSGLSNDISMEEKITRVESVLSVFRPRIDIDRSFQRDLRGSLWTQKTYTWRWQPLWRNLGMAFASFFAIFLLGKLYISDSSVPVKMHTLSYSDAPPGVTGSVWVQNDSHRDLSSIRRASPDRAISEISSISTEVASIDRELLDISAVLSADIVEKKSTPSPQKTVISPHQEESAPRKKEPNPTADIDTLLAMIATPEEPALTASDESLIETPVVVTTPEILADTSRETTPSSDAPSTSVTVSWSDSDTLLPPPPRYIQIPQYSQILLIYIKYGAWTPRERSTRAWEGVVAMPLPARSRYAIELSLRDAMKDSEVQSMNIIYISATRSGDTTRNYLIPAIRYIFTDGSVSHIPLVDGYNTH
jgi:hypothetical protein